MKAKLARLHEALDQKDEEVTKIHADGVIDGFGKAPLASICMNPYQVLS